MPQKRLNGDVYSFRSTTRRTSARRRPPYPWHRPACHPAARCGAGGGGGGTGPAKPAGDSVKKEEKPEPPKKKAPPKRDPKKPTTLTRADKAAKKAAGNPQPKYPSAMQKRGIEGLVVVKMTIDQKARLRKLKFVKVTNNATKESHIAKANEVMKKEVGRALSKWKFTEPCRHPDGQAFTCVMRERFPFKLKR